MKELAGFIHEYLPPRGDEARTFLVLHGTGGNERSLLGLADALLPEAGALSPRGQVLENGMPRFFRRFAEGVLDLDNLREEVGKMHRFLDAAAAEYGFDPGRLIGLGYSNGANMAWTAMLLKPSCLAQLALFRPMVTLPDEADLSGKHIFVSAGRFDPLVPEQNTLELVEQMRSCGADVELHMHDGGHELHRDEIDRARSWLR